MYSVCLLRGKNTISPRRHRGHGEFFHHRDTEAQSLRVFLMRGFISGILALAAASALPVIGQNGAVQPHKAEVTKPQSWVAVPHTAVFMVTIVQKSANGSTNTRSLIQIQARDSQGRTVNASTDVSQGKLVNSSTQYSVTDPVSQTYVDWTSGNKRATVRPMQNIPIPAQHCVAPPAPAPAAVPRERPRQV